MSIKFKRNNDKLYLIYSPRNGNKGVLEKFKNNQELWPIRLTFNFSKNDLEDSKKEIDEFEDFVFLLGKIKNEYLQIDNAILNTSHDVYIQESIFVQKTEYAGINKKLLPTINSLDKIFTASKNISIFSKIDKLCQEPIIIGGSAANAIPLEVFNLLIAKFPNSTELTHYAHARISNILQEYMLGMTDGERKLQEFFRRKEIRLQKIKKEPNNPVIEIPTEMFESEIQKFTNIAKIIKDQLDSKLDSYAEHDWQNLITEILTFIFPQYIKVLSEVTITESYSRSDKKTKRRIDFMLVNANGYIDILEIKKPFASCILRKTEYRDNYVPKIELSGSVMQVEKYIYYLNNLGKNDEEKLTKEYQDQLPNGLDLKIRNPKGFILLGRSNKFEDKEMADFEFIKRKYSNITDIVTYDDLLNRIENIINALKKKLDK